MTVKDAMSEINFVWDRMPAQEKRSVQEHWFWAVTVPKLSLEDEISAVDWGDIMDHIKWFYPRTSEKPATATATDN